MSIKKQIKNSTMLNKHLLTNVFLSWVVRMWPTSVAVSSRPQIYWTTEFFWEQI